MFALADKSSDPNVMVDAIHNEEGYRRVRSTLADSYDVAANEPDIQVVDADTLGDRPLVLRHARRRGVSLSDHGRDATMRHLRWLWGYDVRVEEEE